MSDPPLSDVDFKNKMACVTETVAKKYVTFMPKIKFLILFRRHEQMGSGNSYILYTKRQLWFMQMKINLNIHE